MERLKLLVSKAFIRDGKLIIEVDLDKNFLKQLDPKNSNDYLQHSINTKTNNIVGGNHPRKKRSDRPSLIIRSDKYIPLAKHLSEIIHTKKKIAHTTKQIKAWANEIRRLVEENDISYNRIDSLLDWYEDNIGGEYIPVIESGFSLRMKFMRMEDAMNRKEIKPNKPPIFDDGIKYVYDSKTGEYKHCRTGEVYIP